DGQRVELRFADGGEGGARTWSEQITPHGAEVIATFEGGSLDGEPAVLRHRFGAGTAWYLGTAPDPDTMARILPRVWTEAGVTPVADVPDGVEAVRRHGPDRELLFLLNHGRSDADVSVPSGGMELISGRVMATDRLRLGPREVAIVEEPGIA